VVKAGTKYNLLRLKQHDFEFRNSLKNVKVGQPPTIFKGQIYMGTKAEVDVFGLCSTNGQSGCLQ
jgi:hypothetical protein